MGKKITLELTQDQARELANALELQLKPVKWYINEWGVRNTKLGYAPVGRWTEDSLKNAKDKLAFKQRLITKINAELVKL